MIFLVFCIDDGVPFSAQYFTCSSSSCTYGCTTCQDGNSTCQTSSNFGKDCCGMSNSGFAYYCNYGKCSSTLGLCTPEVSYSTTTSFNSMIFVWIFVPFIFVAILSGIGVYLRYRLAHRIVDAVAHSDCHVQPTVIVQQPTIYAQPAYGYQQPGYRPGYQAQPVPGGYMRV